MTMVRGSNPIWYEVDLTAHAFDDTFYMFVLDNEIPYAPLPTWQDPFGNVAWDNPIRFLANGTLPNNLILILILSIDWNFDKETHSQIHLFIWLKITCLVLAAILLLMRLPFLLTTKLVTRNSR